MLVPRLLRVVSNGEVGPVPLTPTGREAARRAAALIDEAARRQRVDRRAFLRSSAGVAATLFALAACSREERAASNSDAPAGTFGVSSSEATDETAASTTLAALPREVVVDVQTHFLDPDLHGFGASFPQAACGDDPSQCFTTERWLDLVLGASDTAVAVLSAVPIVADPHPMSIELMESARRLAEEVCHDRRVLLQGEAFPQVGDLAESLDRMGQVAEQHQLVAWKTYTHLGRGYRFDDPVGTAFLDRVSELAEAGVGPPVVCVHKGFGADPADVGPAAAAYPNLTFCVYHSGYEPGGPTEGPYRDDGPGVDRFVRSLRTAGVGPGANVYAELGSTWYLSLRDPDEAAHVLGKLLVAVGAERILWGTDSIWYGSPQEQIEAFRAFTISPEAQERFGYPALDDEAKRAILGGNAAALHGLDTESLGSAACGDPVAARAAAADRLGPLVHVVPGPTSAADAARTFAAAHPWFS